MSPSSYDAPPPSSPSLSTSGLSSALPPSPTVQVCPPSPSPSMSVVRRAGPPAPISPPPYYTTDASTLSPSSPISVDELDADPHYRATPTQRSYFVQLSDLFEEARAGKEDSAGQKEQKEKARLPVLRKQAAAVEEDPSPRRCGVCTIS
ncbi:hypothetical protein JCM8547_009160 [Rhodosporidiobolus lusitaniae]